MKNPWKTLIAFLTGSSNVAPSKPIEENNEKENLNPEIEHEIIITSVAAEALSMLSSPSDSNQNKE